MRVTNASRRRGFGETYALPLSGDVSSGTVRSKLQFDSDPSSRSGRNVPLGVFPSETGIIGVVC
jgi:hypothetical protein